MNILIIGATSGIGYELWKHYATMGNTVAITGRRNEILQKHFSLLRFADSFVSIIEHNEKGYTDNIIP